MAQMHLVRAAVVVVRELRVRMETARQDLAATAAMAQQTQSLARQLLMQAAVAVDANLPARLGLQVRAAAATADKVRHRTELQTLAAALAEVVMRKAALAEVEL